MTDRTAGRQRRIQALRALLGFRLPAPPESKGPALIVLSGLPGTGKSHVATAIAARHLVAVLRSDEVRKVLYPVPRYTAGESGRVYGACYALLESLLTDRYVVVFDATNLRRRGRRRARKIAEATSAPSLLVATVAPPEIVAERLRRRLAGEAEAFSSDADWFVHERLADAMDTVTEPAIIVDTSAGSQPAMDAVDALINQATGPLNADCGAVESTCD